MNHFKLAAVAALILGAGAAEAQKVTAGSPPAAPEATTSGKPGAAVTTPDAGATAPEATVTPEAAAPAGADGLILASDPPGVLSALQALGFTGTLGVDAANDPLISGDMEGTPYQIVFFGCQENVNCQWLLFSAGFDLPNGATLDAMNQWNQSHLVGQAYLDGEQDPFLNYFVTTTGGLTQGNFADAVDWWRVVLTEFKTTVGA